MLPSPSSLPSPCLGSSCSAPLSSLPQSLSAAKNEICVCRAEIKPLLLPRLLLPSSQTSSRPAKPLFQGTQCPGEMDFSFSQAGGCWCHGSRIWLPCPSDPACAGGKGRKTFLDFLLDPWMDIWELLTESELSTDITSG